MLRGIEFLIYLAGVAAISYYYSSLKNALDVIPLIAIIVIYLMGTRYLGREVSTRLARFVDRSAR